MLIIEPILRMTPVRHFGFLGCFLSHHCLHPLTVVQPVGITLHGTGCISAQHVRLDWHAVLTSGRPLLTARQTDASADCPQQAVTTKMSRIHAIMNGTAPLHSLQQEKGHLLANSPSAAALSRRLSQVSAWTRMLDLSDRMGSHHGSGA